MDVEIIPNRYNRTTVGADGVTHNIDTSIMRTSYHVAISEYYDIEDEDVLIDAILRDLNRLSDVFKAIKMNRASAKNGDIDKINHFNDYIQNMKMNRDIDELEPGN